MGLRPSGTAFGVSLALLVAMCSLLVYGQSGRRQAKPPVVAPVPSPTPEPTPEPEPTGINFVELLKQKNQDGKDEE
jgi:hypothetical protein